MRKQMFLRHFAHKYGFRVNDKQFLRSLRYLERVHALTVTERGVVLGDDKKRPKIVFIHDPVTIAVHFLGKGKKTIPAKAATTDKFIAYPTCNYANDCKSKIWHEQRQRFVCTLESTCNQQKVPM